MYMHYTDTGVGCFMYMILYWYSCTVSGMTHQI